MSDAHMVARDRLLAFITRIERLEEEKKTIADDIKDVKAEAKGCGFDVGIINAIIKLRKVDAAERAERDALLDTYLIALGMLPEPVGYDESHQSAPAARQPAIARRSDGGLSILTKHEDIRTAPVMAEESPRKAAEAVSERTATQVDADASAEAGVSGQPEMIPATSAESAGEAAGNASDLPTNSPSEDGAIVEVKGRARLANADGVEPPSSVQVQPPSDEREETGILAEDSSAAANAGGDNVESSAPRAGLADPTSNTGEGAANTALPDKPKHRLRPNCLDRSNCKSGSVDHCWSCKKAMAEKSEVAA